MSTAMFRTKPSAPARWLSKDGRIKRPALDYGCGRGVDAKAFKMDRYDPEFFPTPPEGKYQTVLCTYVLNTLPLQEDAEQVLRHVQSLLDQDGRAYITVRRDLEWLTGRTRLGYQWYVMLDLPIIRSIRKSYVIYEMNPESPTAVLVFSQAHLPLRDEE